MAGTFLVAMGIAGTKSITGGLHEGLDWSAKASLRGESNSEKAFETHSNLIGGIKGLIFKLLDDKKNGRLTVNMRMYQSADHGGLIVGRC